MQYYCKPKTALKYNVYFQKYTWKTSGSKFYWRAYFLKKQILFIYG